jgi:diaminohydroxyphosphoribosylaminopyrimidine deaminase/5-amino-6-(5-phosphoribosylamino)uracil reductase
MLRAAGIEVVDNCLAAESAKLNPGFIKRMSMAGTKTKPVPYVRLKMATSLDGRTAMQSGESQWITGPEARAEVQRIRAQSCAIICGADSVLIDDPSMNVRISSDDVDGFSQEIRQPLRVIIDSQHRVLPAAKMFTLAGKVMIVSPIAAKHRISSEHCDITYLLAKTSANSDSHQVDLTSLLEQLASQGINEVLVETGAKLAGAFIQQDLVDELVMFTAPTLLGSDARPAFNLPFAKMDQQIRWSWHDVRMVGNDLKLILKRQH